MKFDPIPYAIGLCAIAIATLVLILAGHSTNNSQDTDLTNASTEQSPGEPKIELPEDNLYLSAQTYTAQKDFIIANNGGGNLILDNLKRSCDCFDVGFYQESSSRKTGRASLGANQQAILRTTFPKESYDEVLARDQSITFQTNDPEHPEERIDLFSLNR